jgi:NAD(P)-dependent dehydrogenase (short-subunit alcohol dehydrogenase family)
MWQNDHARADARSLTWGTVARWTSRFAAGGACGAAPRSSPPGAPRPVTEGRTPSSISEAGWADEARAAYPITKPERTKKTAMAISEFDEVQEQATQRRDSAGRVVVITGGTRGIGAAISRSLAADGAVVAAAYAANQARAEQFQSDLAREGTTISIHHGDVSSASQSRRIIDEVIDRHGRIDVLVNNAGITSDRLVTKMTEDAWRKVIDTNLAGPFFMSQAALETMVEQGSGRIVNVSSIIGQTGNIGQANYASSKAGVFGLTMSLAKEAAFMLAKAGRLDAGSSITVNAVAPGFIETEMLDTVPPKVLDGIRAQVPLQRLGRPEEVAAAVRFLASDAASYVNGQVLAVNGGMYM